MLQAITHYFLLLIVPSVQKRQLQDPLPREEAYRGRSEASLQTNSARLPCSSVSIPQKPFSECIKIIMLIGYDHYTHTVALSMRKICSSLLICCRN